MAETIKKSSHLSLIVVVTLALCATAQSAPLFQAVELPGAYSINDSGEVAGYFSEFSGTGVYYNFNSASGGPREEFEAYAIDNAGYAVIRLSSGGYGVVDTRNGFNMVRTLDGGREGFGDQFVSPDGYFSGTSGLTPNGDLPPGSAVVQNIRTGAVEYFGEVGVRNNPFPLAVNNNREVVGVMATTSDGFYWSPGDGLNLLQEIDPSDSTTAWDISDNGIIVGTRDAADGSTHGLVWSSRFSAPFQVSEIQLAPVINDFGQVIAGGENGAIYWDSQIGSVPLIDLIDPSSPNFENMGGFSIASSANSRGEFIVRGRVRASNSNSSRGASFLLRPMGSVPLTSPGTSLLRPVSNLQSEFEPAVFDPSRPVAVVTHGWQPPGFSGPFGSTNPIEQLARAIHEASAIQDQSGDMIDQVPRGNVLVFNWEGAHRLLPGSSLAATDDAGAELAEALRQYLGPDYIQPIHFVGHSHGSVVNAEAIESLQDEYLIGQATLLDTPREIRSAGLGALLSPSALISQVAFGSAFIEGQRGSVSEQQLLNLMPAGSVSYVESYYGNALLPIPGFGAPLTFAGPNEQLVSGAGHSEVWDGFFIDLVGSEEWISPLGNREQYFDVSTNNPWTPISILDVITEIPAGAAQVGVGVLDFATSVTTTVAGVTVEAIGFASAGVFDAVGYIIDGAELQVPSSNNGVTIDGVFYPLDLDLTATSNSTTDYIVATENSPSSALFDLDIPVDASFLSFDLLSFLPGDGDWLTVSINDEFVYTYALDNASTSVVESMIPVGNYAGSSNLVTLALNSVGQSGAQFVAGNFVFLGESQFPVGKVPLPSPILLLLLGLLAMVATTGAEKRRSLIVDSEATAVI